VEAVLADLDDTPTMPAIISRADAKAMGLRHYFTGAPCPEGHIAERYVRNGYCAPCARAYAAIKNAKRGEGRRARRDATRTARQKHSERPIVARSEAKAAGLRHYFTGAPCAEGHIAERFTNNGYCVICAKHKHNAWRTANPEKMKAAGAAWIAANPDKIQARSASYYAKNAEQQRQKTRDWAKANPDKLAARGARRRARERNAEGVYTAMDVQRIYATQKGKCACCQKNVGNDYHVDHIQPLSKGGNNWPTNLQILCPTCNVRKSARDPIEFMRSLGRLL
jgi:5-methylcytosine-specific restriction endonuclease McrA